MQAIQNCKGLPLAVALIAGIQLETRKDWENAIANIFRQDINLTLPNYQFSLFGTFQSSIKQLSKDEQQLFRLLGVFKRVNIPITSIMSLWNLDKLATKLVLDNFNRRSLLKFTDSER